MGGWAAAHVDSKKERRQGVNFLSEKRLRRVSECGGVIILVSALASAKRGHSRIMWVGEQVTGQRKVSGGSHGQKRKA